MNPEHMTPIEGSSQLAKAGHDGTDLFLQFQGGGLYRYAGVPPEHLADLLSAKSAGKHFNANIRGQFPHEKVSP